MFLQEKEMQLNIENLSQKNDDLSKSYSELEALNTNWSQKNNELTEKNKELQVKHVIHIL